MMAIVLDCSVITNFASQTIPVFYYYSTYLTRLKDIFLSLRKCLGANITPGLCNENARSILLKIYCDIIYYKSCGFDILFCHLSIHYTFNFMISDIRYTFSFMISDFFFLVVHNSFLQTRWPICLFPVAEPCLRLFNQLKTFKPLTLSAQQY